MKKSFKRLASMLTALSLCASLAVSAAAIPTTEELEQAVSSIQLNATANQLSDGSYQVQYKADLTMSDIFAQAVSALNTGDYLKNLQFTCVLEDELVKQLSLDDVSFTFTGPGASNFIPDGENYISKGPRGELMIRYQLDPQKVDEWPYVPASQLPAILMQQMSMTSARKTVSAAQLDAARGADGILTTDARVEITYEGGNIPVYNEPSILAAESKAVTMTVIAYDDDDDDDTPNFRVNVDDDHDHHSDEKGHVTPSTPSARPGQTVTVTVMPDDGFRLADLIITDTRGNKIDFTVNTDGTLSFQMPNSHVTVEPVFDLSAARPEDSGVSSTLNIEDHIAFMIGDDQGNFRPNASITRAEVAQIFYALLKDKNVPITVSFDDVDEDAWYAKAVNTLASLGAVKGVGQGKFAPERNITRAEFATIAANFAKQAKNPFDFADVDESHWAYPYISATAAYGWVAGVGNNSFEPDRGIMRAEAATIVNNMLGRMGDKDKIDAGLGRAFPDVDKSHWGWYEIGEASFAHKAVFNDAYTKETWLDK